MRDRVQQALIYPAFLALAGAILVTIFITFMVPQLTGFMAQTGGALPLPTRILLQIHHLITGYWWAAGLAIIGVIIGFRALLRSHGTAFTRSRNTALTWKNRQVGREIAGSL